MDGYYMHMIVHVSWRFLGSVVLINIAAIFYDLFVWFYLDSMYMYKYTNILVQKIKSDQIIGNLDFLVVKVRLFWRLTKTYRKR